MLWRGVQVGLVGGVGFDLTLAYLSEGKITPDFMVFGLVAGLGCGVVMGLVLLAFYTLLRLVDRQTGWGLASLLRASEPGPAGIVVGLLATGPGLMAGGLGMLVGCWNWAMHSHSSWGFYFFLFTCPFWIIAGAFGGAMLGAILGNGLVAFIRGLFRR